MKLLLNILFLFVGKQGVESFSIRSEHNYHNRQVKLLTQTKRGWSSSSASSRTFISLQIHTDENNDIDKSRSNKDRIRSTLNSIGDKVTKGKGTKEINMELVLLGQKFDSFRRRFDYFSLLKGNVVSDIHCDSNNDNDSQRQHSLWIRENDQNVNVESFMRTSRGLSSQEAKAEAQSFHTQSYRLTDEKSLGTSSYINEEKKKSLTPNVAVNYQVMTHDGTPAIGDDDELSQYIKKVKWEGDKYITEFMKNDETFDLVMRVEKYLVFPNDDSTKNQIIMTVNSTLYQPGNEDGDHTIHCQEFFRPAYAIESKDDDSIAQKHMSSEISRVPGCVSNVNVFTTLIPIKDTNRDELPENQQTFHVMVDGEADTLLSRGLLSVLSSALSSFNSNDIMKIDSYTIADELKLRSVLSAGRNDGLSNMISVIQNQVTEIINKMQSPRLSNNELRNKDGKDEPKVNSSDRPTVAMLLSGGVDSAVALNLLKQQNYNVTAFYLKIWLEDELAHLGQCPWEDDYNVCIDVCKHAGNIPLEAISLQDAYKERVISYTIEEAKKGRTPNPDIMCNSRIKFGCFYDAIADRGFDYVASGHYAQLVRIPGGKEGNIMQLHRAPDPVKDQSYFLAALRQDQLKRVLFPIGHLQKSEVRVLAEEFDLPNKSRPDSQGLCFLGKVKFDEFLSAYLGQEPGEIIDADTGETIGQHKGIWYHTVGQRKGIGKVLDPKATSKGPWYVVAKDPNNRKIIASNKYDEEVFQETRSSFCVEDIKWISGYEPVELKAKNNEMTLKMKIRHGPTIVDGILRLDSVDTGTVRLHEKDGGLAPGQFVVFYNDVECLGSGVISEKHWLKFQTQSFDLRSEKKLSI